MAVPKTHTSKMKKRSRKSHWKRKADLNANPVFHPPLESKVPEYPPIEGQHWYQYVVVDGSVNPL